MGEKENSLKHTHTQFLTGVVHGSERLPVITSYRPVGPEEIGGGLAWLLHWGAGWFSLSLTHSLPLVIFPCASLVLFAYLFSMPQVRSHSFWLPYSPFTIEGSLPPVLFAPLSFYASVKLLFFHREGDASLSIVHTLTHTGAPGEVISLGLQLSEQQASDSGGYRGYRLTTHLLPGWGVGGLAVCVV